MKIINIYGQFVTKLTNKWLNFYDNSMRKKLSDNTFSLNMINILV